MQLTKPRITADEYQQLVYPEPSVANTRVLLFAYPDKRVPIDLAEWVFQRYRQPGRPRDNVLTLSIEGLVQARNRAVRDFALKAPRHFRWFLFMDRDIHPEAASDEIYKLKTDVRCCRVPTKNPRSWQYIDSFHDQFWLARREVLEGIRPPWFMFPYSADGCTLGSCLCESFRRKVLDAGFTIGNAGYAGHDSDGSWC